MAIMSLPKDKKELVQALNQEIGHADTECNIQKAGWKIVDGYLAGARHFNVVDPIAGSMEIAYENWDGSMQLRFEQILQDFSTEVGRLQKMAIDPVCTRRGESLDALRKGAIAHATLGTLVAPLNLDNLKVEALKMIVKYGTVGIEHWETDDPVFRDAVSVIHPRELRGLPAWTDGKSGLRALVRKRDVPLDWIKGRINRMGKNVSTNLTDLKAVKVPWGTSSPNEAANRYSTGSPSVGTPVLPDPSTSKYGFGAKVAKKMKDEEKPDETGRYFVCLEEIYVLDIDPAYMCRYIIKIGDTIPVDDDFERPGYRVVCPIQVARYTDTGRFHGRGYVGPQIPLNDVIERMLGNFFQNVIDMDVYGTVLIPDTWNVDTDTWKAGRRPRYQTYSPDLSTPNHQQILIQPATSGMLPSKAAEVGLSIQQTLSGHGPMFQGEATGRMDSASGHGFLFDVANIRLSMPVNSFADAIVGVYGRLLQSAKARYGDDDTMKLTAIDEAMAGVVVGKDGALSLSDNPIPEPWEVTIDIKDRMPRDLITRKQELKELFQMSLVTPTSFWLAAHDEKLDFPGSPRDLIESYRKAIWQVVMLFGNGKEPGLIDVGQQSTNPEVQLMVVQRFMNKIEFSLADQKVREAFEQWKMVLEQMLGKGFPEGLMPPDQAAMQQQQMMSGGGGPMGPGMGP